MANPIFYCTMLLGCRLVLATLLVCPCLADEAESHFAWPEPTQSARPWTRWWWHGSAVDHENLTRLLKQYADVGLGGVEITCIYGVKGQEERALSYRSYEWVQAVQHAVKEADRLGLGVDLPAGSGWRMGGPNVPPELANTQVVLQHKTVTGPGKFSYEFGARETPQAAVAQNQRGDTIILTDQIDGKVLRWRPPEGEWEVDTVAYRWAGDRVKRPAPGGAGLNINPFWRESVDAFLQDFGGTLDQLPGVRAQFHDSFEYEGNWAPDFLQQFSKRRGYRLEPWLAQLNGTGDPEVVARVKADYRATLGDLVREHFIGRWVDWAHQHGMLARNQSHGSPANWLDLYAACDIPEIESFGRLVGGDANHLSLKFASSAANIAGRPLVSSETATWLDEHFHVELAEIKQIVDRQILAGVNHVFFHGTAYSPADADWPGWLFYASTQLNPQNPIWRDLPTLNTYITRCQGLLQQAEPDTDVLLYWPLHDTWHDRRGLRTNLSVHNSKGWLLSRPLGEAAQLLASKGYSFDYTSDRLLQKLRPGENGELLAPGGAYRAIVIPQATHAPLPTMRQLNRLAQAGCPVIFWKDWPRSLPGMAGHEGLAEKQQDRSEFKHLYDTLEQSGATMGGDLERLLSQAGVRREAWVRPGQLEMLRKQYAGDSLYFINNPGAETVDQWVELSTQPTAALVLDPSSGEMGTASQRNSDAGKRTTRVRLAPGESLFLLATDQPRKTNPWDYATTQHSAVPLDGSWRVEFIEGGPSLPAPFQTVAGPQPWTAAADPAAEAFAGAAAYSYQFTPPKGARRLVLDLGEVAGSARVSLNGKLVATLLGPTCKTVLEDVESGQNELVIEVTGVAANRIRDLDRRGVPWRIFEDINLVTINYRRFDASNWPIQQLGLIGPVTVTPLD